MEVEDGEVVLVGQEQHQIAVIDESGLQVVGGGESEGGEEPEEGAESNKGSLDWRG